MRILALRMVPSDEFAAALSGLRRSDPGCDITAALLTPKGREEVEAAVGAQRVQVAAGGLAGYWGLWRSLRGEHFDQAVVFAHARTRPAPRAWPAYVLALSARARQRRLVSDGRSRGLTWAYLLSELVVFPMVAAGAFVLLLAPLGLVALALGADLLRALAGPPRTR